MGASGCGVLSGLPGPRPLGVPGVTTTDAHRHGPGSPPGATPPRTPVGGSTWGPGTLAVLLASGCTPSRTPSHPQPAGTPRTGRPLLSWGRLGNSKARGPRWPHRPFSDGPAELPPWGVEPPETVLGSSAPGRGPVVAPGTSGKGDSRRWARPRRASPGRERRWRDARKGPDAGGPLLRARRTERARWRGVGVAVRS